MKPRALFAAIACLPLLMCGGRTSDSDDGGGNPSGSGGTEGGDLDANLRSDVYAWPSCSDIPMVPAGEAYVGAWQIGATKPRSFAPSSQCDITHPGSKRLSVQTFWLMDEPATNACYWECFNQGACTPPTHDISDPDPRPWTDPHRAQEPVYVDHTMAAAFCAWIGGYLPSLAQLARAAQGDAPKPGVGTMTDATIACDQTPDAGTQLCGQLASMDLTNPANALYPVGQVAVDVGPFGHHDLFGEGLEWTRTFADFEDPKFCALADGAPDYVSFAGDAFSPGVNQFSAVQFATLEKAALRQLDEGASSQLAIPGDADPSTANYTTTFRCAFDSLGGAGKPHDG